jgi:N-acetylglucosaminyldiphosphoundecaprenol N-acetyl-beta-D-mannosaminyltransferase
VNALPSKRVVSLDVNVISRAEATERVLVLAQRAAPAYVCAANVHMTMEAFDDPGFADVVHGASLVVPDGMPLVWAQRLLGARGAERVRGPDLVLSVARAAAREQLPIAVYGGSPDVARAFTARLRDTIPGIDVRTVISPPFRPRSEAEIVADVEQLRDSGARIVFVGLGCPKQERWMASVTDRLDAVLLGVGAAFDFHAGTVREAPRWMMAAGLEWLHRLVSEPGRLWRRYLKHNPRFLVQLARQLLGPGDRGNERA